MRVVAARSCFAAAARAAAAARSRPVPAVPVAGLSSSSPLRNRLATVRQQPPMALLSRASSRTKGPLVASPIASTATPIAFATATAAAAAASAAAALSSSPPIAVVTASAIALAVFLLRLAARATVGHLPVVHAAGEGAKVNGETGAVDQLTCVDSICSRVPSLREPLLAPALLAATPLGSGGHAETIFAAKARLAPGVTYERELLEMPDGGTVALDTLVEEREEQEDDENESDIENDTENGTLPRLRPDSPVLVILPGLTGGSHDAYVQHLAASARRGVNFEPFRPVVFNSRGTSDSPVTSAQFYSASFVADLDRVISRIAEKHPEAPIVAAGYSLGANILVNYLGGFGEKIGEEAGSGFGDISSSSSSSRHLVAAAVSMANPFDLSLSDKNFEKGFNRIYDFNLARSLRTIFARHAHLWERLSEEEGGGEREGGEERGEREEREEDERPKKLPFDPARAKAAKTIRDFDDAITRVSFGWPSVDAYYAGSSSALRVARVRVPLLCLQALDDPIAPAEAIPRRAISGNPNVVLATTRTGGHLGWCCAAASRRVGREEEVGEVGGRRKRLFTGAPWCDAPTVEFLASALEQLREEGKLPSRSKSARDSANKEREAVAVEAS